MVSIHNLGFPRIGRARELKFALESYWKGDSDAATLQETATQLRAQNWAHQADMDLTPVGDYALYDQVLDTSFLLGHIPERIRRSGASPLDQYFQIARGRSTNKCQSTQAGEMTKWFDTNYHYIVPELHEGTRFSLQPERLIAELKEAQNLGTNAKPVIIGPVTYLWLSKVKDHTAALDYLAPLLDVYQQLLSRLVEAGVEWVQIDEPILVTELTPEWRKALEKTYHALTYGPLKILLATYFGTLEDNLQLACNLPASGLHLDAVRARSEVNRVIDWLPSHKVLSLGVIDGRNIWKTDLTKTLDWLEPIAQRLHNRLWLAPSCSLLHVPLDLNNEPDFDPEIKNWLAFAIQKLEELNTLKLALNSGRDAVRTTLADNKAALANRAQSVRVNNSLVRKQLAELPADLGNRQSPYTDRAAIQADQLKLPAFPTTTIGSFPQTNTIRTLRAQFKNSDATSEQYRNGMRDEIARTIQQQEQLGLDVLVHGEPERNDMVEYFGEQLNGYAFSKNGWVQSYGSRCVKPPIIFGDISRPKAMTVDWSCYAQSLTRKPVKGMLTGPVTMLNWSFVRDDQPRKQTALQLALAIRQEVLDLESAGLKIIQIDEAALREGLPLRKKDWSSYLDWAVESFRVSANGVDDATQIHTHMCYSDFNDIITAIAALDADVITIENSRSDNELLLAFDKFNYLNDIGPGVYDIHSPNIPTTEQVVALIASAAKRIPSKQLWINPDCGLKTRQWHEVIPALQNMVSAARYLRTTLAKSTSAKKGRTLAL